MRTHPSSADISLGILGAALLVCATVFGITGIPQMPPALLVVAGIPSPLTGMTRSFVATAQGELPAAFDLHPLGPLTFLACVVALASLLCFALSGKRPALVQAILRPGFAWAAAVAFTIVWIRRLVVG